MPKGRIVGVGKCPYCGFDKVEFRVSEKNGYLYATCPPLADGGCQSQHFPRSEAASEHLAKNIAKWRTKADRDKWGGKAKAPAPADDDTPAAPSETAIGDPAPSRVKGKARPPKAAPELPAPVAGDDVPWYEREF